jgi:hypothetical protein
MNRPSGNRIAILLGFGFAFLVGLEWLRIAFAFAPNHIDPLDLGQTPARLAIGAATSLFTAAILVGVIVATYGIFLFLVYLVNMGVGFAIGRTWRTFSSVGHVLAGRASLEEAETEDNKCALLNKLVGVVKIWLGLVGEPWSESLTRISIPRFGLDVAAMDARVRGRASLASIALAAAFADLNRDSSDVDKMYLATRGAKKLHRLDVKNWLAARRSVSQARRDISFGVVAEGSGLAKSYPAYLEAEVEFARSLGNLGEADAQRRDSKLALKQAKVQLQEARRRVKVSSSIRSAAWLEQGRLGGYGVAPVLGAGVLAVVSALCLLAFGAGWPGVGAASAWVLLLVFAPLWSFRKATTVLAVFLLLYSINISFARVQVDNAFAGGGGRLSFSFVGLGMRNVCAIGAHEPGIGLAPVESAADGRSDSKQYVPAVLLSETNGSYVLLVNRNGGALGLEQWPIDSTLLTPPAGDRCQ